MTRAERRRKDREQKKSETATYNLTIDQLDQMVRDRIAKEIEDAKEQSTRDAIDVAMLLMVNIPMKVLKDHYWKKTYDKKLPEFYNLVMDYFEKWQSDEFNIYELQNEMKKYNSIKILEDGYSNEN